MILYGASSVSFGYSAYLHASFVLPRIEGMTAAEMLSLWPIGIALLATALTAIAALAASRGSRRATALGLGGAASAAAYYLLVCYSIFFLIGANVVRSPATVVALLLPIGLIIAIGAHSRRALRAS